LFLENDSWPRLIPEEEPPFELVPAAARDLARRLVERPLLYRSYLWASALLNVGFQSPIPVPPRFSHVSAGFVPARVVMSGGEPIVQPGVGFGIYILAGGNEFRRVQTIRVGERYFPVVTASGQRVLHGRPPNPLTAASTCWVRNGGTYRGWQQGILTCRHAVHTNPIGTSIALAPSVHHSSPASATLADIDECTIDAAVLEIPPTHWPSGLKRLSVATPSTPGQLVGFQNHTGVSQSGHILRVFNYNTYIGNLFGQRVITDCHGVAGDSGSLLVDSATNEAVGIYMGTIPDGAGSHDGLFQDMAQVESYFQLELYY
jgi:hypothetical protein